MHPGARRFRRDLYWHPGDIIVAVKDAIRAATLSRGCRQGKIVVRTVKERRRPTAATSGFDENAAVIIKPDNDPRGTRILDRSVARLQEKRFMKIIRWPRRCCR